MGIYRELSPMEIRLGFVASCVEFLATALNKSYVEVYRRMHKVGMLEQYVFKHYDTLHTQSREFVTEDLINYLNRKESNGCD